LEPLIGRTFDPPQADECDGPDDEGVSAPSRTELSIDARAACPHE
jgi:hypothetical protein